MPFFIVIVTVIVNYPTLVGALPLSGRGMADPVEIDSPPLPMRYPAVRALLRRSV